MPPASAFNPWARPKPSNRLTADPLSPITSASNRTESGDLRPRRAERPEQGPFPAAPATTIEKVFRIRKVPDEERDRGEHQQDGGDDELGLLQLALVLCSDLRVGDCLETRMRCC